MCRVLGVSRSGFHAWERRPLSERDRVDGQLLERIRRMHERSRGSYGSRRIFLDLREDGVRVGKKRVERLMRSAGLSGYMKRRKGKTTIRVQGVRPASDLVGRDFNPTAPDRLWCADIKEVANWEGKLYLASVLDCFSRRVVGWSMRDDLKAELVVDALAMAVARRRPPTGLIHHSDRGSLGGFNWSSQHLVWRWCAVATGKRQQAIRAMRGQMWSPGRPSVARR